MNNKGAIITTHGGIGPSGRRGFGLAVALHLHAPNLSRVEAEDLMRRAMSKAGLHALLAPKDSILLLMKEARQ